MHPEFPARAAATADEHPLPPSSQIVVDRFPAGVTIQIPPAGIRGTKGLFFIALVWETITALLTPVFVLPLISGKGNQDGGAIALVLLLAVFWLVGIGLLLAALNLARRRAVLAVTGGTLMVLQTGLLGSKQRDFEPGDVETIQVGPSGMTVNDKAVLELQIVDGGSQQMGLLAGRSDEELYWIAAELTRALERGRSAAG